MNNWAILDINFTSGDSLVTIQVTTNTPVHLTCYFSSEEPLRHRSSRTLRGLTMPWGAYFCFVSWQTSDQLEPGDTYIHTFIIYNWIICQTIWFLFKGTVLSIPSPSISPIFEHHKLIPAEETEEQLLYNGFYFLAKSGIWDRSFGQRITIPNRTISNLSFLLKQAGIASGNVFYVIRRIDDSILANRFQGPAYAISPTPTWYPVNFNPPVTINEEVRLTVETTLATQVANSIHIARQSGGSVKPAQQATALLSAGGWLDAPDEDCAYIYTYIFP